MKYFLLFTITQAFNWINLANEKPETICQSETLSPGQQRLCSRTKIGEILPEAIKRTISSCKETMTDKRWNCNHLRRSSRESAYLEALSTAQLIRTAEHKCLEGNCGAFTHVRELIELEPMSKLKRAIRKHNIQVGIGSIKRNTKCRCHGQSGACTAQTCWDQSEDVAVTLKKKYESAVQIEKKDDPIQIPAELALLTPHFKNRLLYSRNDDDFCRLTRGRKCQLEKMNGSHCSKMCCGRGFVTKETKTKRPDQCTFQWPNRIDCETSKTVTVINHVCI